MGLHRLDPASRTWAAVCSREKWASRDLRSEVSHGPLQKPCPLHLYPSEPEGQSADDAHGMEHCVTLSPSKKWQMHEAHSALRVQAVPNGNPESTDVHESVGLPPELPQPAMAASTTMPNTEQMSGLVFMAYVTSSGR